MSVKSSDKTLKVAAPAHQRAHTTARQVGRPHRARLTMSDDVGQLVSVQDMLLHAASPHDYPCYSKPEGCDKVFYKSTSGCRAKCCMVPACTPEGEDSPKWKAKLAEREEGESPFAQPDFGEPETPDKTVLPDDYEAETGCTPPTDLAHVTYHHRLNHVRWGVPGESSDTPFCLGTPKRQKTSGD